jgi:hypothetical protein
MEYEVTNKYARVTITSEDIDKNATDRDIFSYMPKEVIEFKDKHKDKPNYKETYINGRTNPYPQDIPNTLFDGVVYYFELT